MSRRRGRKRPIMTDIQASDSATLELGGGAVEVEAQQGDGETRRFSMVAYTGAKIMPGGWRKKEPLVLRISGASSSPSIPMHRDHDRGRVVGHSTSIAKNTDTLSVQGEFSVDNEHSREIVSASDNGFPWQASVGANLGPGKPRFIAAGQTLRVNGQQMTGPFWLQDKWTLKEASFLSLGADDRTAAVAAEELLNMGPFEKWLEANNIDISRLSEAQVANLRAAFDAVTARQSDDTATAAGGGTSDVAAGDGDSDDDSGNADAGSDLDVVATTRQQVAAELERHNQIRETFADYPQLQAQAVREGWSEDRQQLELYRANDARLQAMRDSRPQGPGIHSRSSDDVMTNEVISAGLHLSLGRPVSDEFLTAEYGEQNLELARRLPRHAGLHWLCTQTIRAAGGYVEPGLGMTNDLWNEAVQADRRLQRGEIQAASGFSTFTLSGTMSNLANKRLLQIYREWPSLVERLCGRASHTDFKTWTKYRVSGDLELEELAPTGEIQHGSLDEQTYQNMLITYAKMLSVTRRDFFNDDLGAFDQIGTHMGLAAMRTREKSFFTLLADTATTFYGAPNAAGVTNLLAGQAAFDIAALRAAKLLLAGMQSPEGNPIMIMPDIIVTSQPYGEDAENILQKTTIAVENPTGSARDLRVFDQYRGQFAHESTPWLNTGNITGAIDTTWYLFGERGIVNAYEYATLSGQEAPMTASADTDFNTLGFQTRIVWDWGFAEQDSRGVIRVTV